MLARVPLLLATLCIACAGWPGTVTVGTRPETGTIESDDTRGADVGRLLAATDFAFRDPETLIEHRALPPFELLESDGERLLFSAQAGIGRPDVRVTIVDRSGRLWAFFEFGHREFATLLQDRS